MTPPGHVHVSFPNVLDGTIKGGSVPVVILADGKEPLEVVTSPVQAQRREQPGSATVAIPEWVDVYQLELGDAACQYRMGFLFAI